MPTPRAARLAFPKGASPIELPEFIYASGSKYRLLISVLGKQHFLGSWEDLEIARVQRDLALHTLKPWLRCKLPELIAVEDLTLVEKNSRLESLLATLTAQLPNGIHPADEREKYFSRLERIEAKLDHLIKLLEADR